MTDALVPPPEYVELRPRLEHTNTPFHWVRCVDDYPMVIRWSLLHDWWVVHGFEDGLSPREAGRQKWTYWKPCDPSAITLDPDAIATRILNEVMELPDRTSPDDWPEAMLVTGDELVAIVKDVLGDVRR